MKKLLYFLLVPLVIACQPMEQESSEGEGEAEAEASERSIGFATALPETKWHLGKDDAIDLVKDLDKVWADRDYERLKTFFADTASFNFADGRRASSPQEFVDILIADDGDSPGTWTFDYAFSVDLAPETGGEHVQAGFTGTSTEDGVETQTRYHESYYIIDGKVVWWNQYTQKVPAEEDEAEE